MSKKFIKNLSKVFRIYKLLLSSNSGFACPYTKDEKPISVPNRISNVFINTSDGFLKIH